MSSPLKIADRQFNSRLFLGTGKFASNQIMREAVLASKSELVTVALKRIDIADKDDQLLSSLKIPNVSLLPNTSGARNAKEAILAANLAREALETNWVKLEIHPDPNYLMPDPIETLEAAKILAADNFVVLPYIHADPVLCKKLEDVGVSAVMPLAAPIGSNLGLSMIHMLQIIVEQSEVPVIVDAGLGAPSHAAQALEIGADAVLVNTAIAVCENPQNMALAFALAVEAGRLAFEAKLASAKLSAQASSPLTAFAA
jgi:thiazole synthase